MSKKNRRTLFELYWRRAIRGERPDDCWGWSGNLNNKGYTSVQIVRNGRAKNYLCHRLSYLIHKGRIPKGLDVMHSCDNPVCTNPRHLDVGTRKDNMMDAARKGRAKGTSLPGESNPNSILTDDLVRYIRSVYSGGGVTQHALASSLGLTRAVVADVVGYRSWKHVTEAPVSVDGQDPF